MPRTSSALTRRIRVAVVLSGLAAAGTASAQNFTGLGLLPGGNTSIANGVSGNGAIVVGSANVLIFGSPSVGYAVRWTDYGSGVVSPPQVLSSLGGSNAGAFAANSDGSIVAGQSYLPGNTVAHACRWSSAGLEDLQPSPSTDTSVAYGVSADGSVVVGGSTSTSYVNRAFRWTNTTGMQNFDAPGATGSLARAVSADGLTVVGVGYTTIPFRYSAFRWSSVGGMQSLPTTIPGTDSSYAYGVNADGSVVVGQAWTVGQPVSNAFRWTSSVGMQDLVPVGGTQPVAKCVSGDGSVVVGAFVSSANANHAFRWTGVGGMQDLNTYLPTLGIDLSGWVLFDATGVSADGETIVGNGTHNGQTQAWVANVPMDSDGDGLYDKWETDGIPYTKADGSLGRYVLPGANPWRKDIYVEVDAMQGRAPAAWIMPADEAARFATAGLSLTGTALDEVVSAFLDAPVPAPSGAPAGTPDGIALHVVVNATNLPLRDYPGDFVQFQEDKAIHFGTAVERADTNWPTMRDAKRKAYRYCIFANTYAGSRSSGLAEPTGDDFMVTLGQPNWLSFSGRPEMVAIQAGTFMHELGHTLGLHHGGGDDINYKPNYYSIMNYSWQFPPQIEIPGKIGWALRYSDAQADLLNESALTERLGISGGYNPDIYYFVRVPYSLPASTPGCTTPGQCFGFARLGTFRVDWNQNGITDDPGDSRANINAILENASSPDGEALRGYDDWPHLQYSFRDSEYYAAGAVPSDADLPVEMDYDTYVFLATIPPPCDADLNCDGAVTIDDLLFFLAAFEAGDRVGADVDDGSATGNVDGGVDINDLLFFLTHFETGC